MSDILTIVGTYDGIKEKSSGWYEVEVAVPGKQYPYRLATKSSTVLDKVRATNGQIATFTYRETESDRINPHTNKPYTNRYLDDVVAGATPAAQASSDATAGGNSERMTKEEWNAKDRRDFRSRAWAQTISAFAHTITPADDPMLIFAKLKPFQRKLYEDIVGDLEPKPQAQPAPAAPAAPAAGPSEYSDEPPPYTDDDIPF